MKNWLYSLLLIPLYVGVFLFWRAAPSRTSFVLGSLVVAGLMSAVLYAARRKGYFAGRADFLLHAYIVVDVLLEGFAFEVLLLGNRIGLLSAAEVSSLRSMVTSFHDNANFYGCTAFFIVFIGGHRWFALRRRSQIEAASSATDGPKPNEPHVEPQ